MTTTEILERFFAGKMDAEELKKFNERVEKDADFARTLAFWYAVKQTAGTSDQRR